LDIFGQSVEDILDVVIDVVEIGVDRMAVNVLRFVTIARLNVEANMVAIIATTMAISHFQLLIRFMMIENKGDWNILEYLICCPEVLHPRCNTPLHLNNFHLGKLNNKQLLRRKNTKTRTA
jgi:hypothetical protein